MAKKNLIENLLNYPFINLFIKRLTTENLIFFLLTIFMVTSRLIQHQFNFTAVIAGCAIFSFLYAQKAFKIVALPVLAMFCSDLYIGFHSGASSVYLAFALSALPFILFSEKLSSVKVKFISILASSLTFFVVSNLAVFLMNGLYPMTFEGFVNCFYMALPFYKNQFASDFILTATFYPVFTVLKSKLDLNFSNIVVS